MHGNFQWGLYALRHGGHISMEARRQEWLVRLWKFLRMRIYQIEKPEQLGRPRSVLVTSRAQRAGPTITVASAVATCGWSAGTGEACSLSWSQQRGSSTRMATRWSSHRPACSVRYRSPHVSLSANDPFLRAPAHFALTVHTFCRQMSTSLRDP